MSHLREHTMRMIAQHDFDNTIGRLDNVLSLLIGFSKGDIGDVNQQTLKHHAEDMIATGNSILKRLGKDCEGTPQPEPESCSNIIQDCTITSSTEKVEEKTPGQIAFEAFSQSVCNRQWNAMSQLGQKQWEAAAAAVRA